MANLIRLKQIESGSQLQTSAQIGSEFSQSVIDIITGEVQAVLPDGIVSSSAQIYITGTIGYNDIATDIEVAIVSSSISASQLLISSSISSSIASTLSGSLLSVTNLSSSVSTSLTLLSASSNSRLNNLEITSASVNDKFNTLEGFTSSLDNGFATDLELQQTSSQIIDQGEW
jgi:hypothetical protein